MSCFLFSERDFFCSIITFSSCLALGVEVGLLVGVAVNICQLLYLWARPSISVQIKVNMNKIFHSPCKNLKKKIIFRAPREEIIISLRQTSDYFSQQWISYEASLIKTVRGIFQSLLTVCISKALIIQQLK